MDQKTETSDLILAHQISGLSMTLGICKASFDNNSNRIISHMPISLFPYLLKSQTYHKIRRVHFIWQKLFVKLASDCQFVLKLAEKFCSNDPYMIQILNIYKKEYKNQKVGVACSRIDYMGDNSPKLVQFNLMSVGLNGISDRVQQLHKTLNKYNKPEGKYKYTECKNQQTICKALILALQQAELKDGIVLMVIHEKEFNYGDQNLFRIQMIKQGRRSDSITFNQLVQKMKFDEQTKIAYLGQKHIDAFYFRTGYAVSHFPTKKHWQVRQKIQISRSIKLPSIQMIIINSKRVQSQLSKQNVLQKYLCEEQVQLILSVSEQIFDFDDKNEKQIQQLIGKTENDKYVLKPNRQGGGNNFFGKKVYQKLKQLQKQNHLNNYILMKKIQSQSHQNYFIFDHQPRYMPKVTGEFSTLGSFVYEKDKILMSQMGGTLVRLKDQKVDQGGIAINQGVISGLCIQNYTEE